MPYYTGKGDTGQTQGLDGARRPKADPLIETSGSFDEAQVALGFAAVEAQSLARECVHASEILVILQWMQRALFQVAALTLDGVVKETDSATLTQMMTRVKGWCMRFEPEVKRGSFYLPGGSELAARIELARVALRRCERNLCAISEDTVGVVDALPLLNRLSALTYALARYANQILNVSEEEV